MAAHREKPSSEAKAVPIETGDISTDEKVRMEKITLMGEKLKDVSPEVLRHFFMSERVIGMLKSYTPEEIAVMLPKPALKILLETHTEGQSTKSKKIKSRKQETPSLEKKKRKDSWKAFMEELETIKDPQERQEQVRARLTGGRGQAMHKYVERRKKPYVTNKADEFFGGQIERIQGDGEKELGYSFYKPLRLAMALTHKGARIPISEAGELPSQQELTEGSEAYSIVADNRALELYGDELLDIKIEAHLDKFYKTRINEYLKRIDKETDPEKRKELETDLGELRHKESFYKSWLKSNIVLSVAAFHIDLLDVIRMPRKMVRHQDRLGKSGDYRGYDFHKQHAYGPERKVRASGDPFEALIGAIDIDDRERLMDEREADLEGQDLTRDEIVAERKKAAEKTTAIDKFLEKFVYPDTSEIHKLQQVYALADIDDENFYHIALNFNKLANDYAQVFIEGPKLDKNGEEIYHLHISPQSKAREQVGTGLIKHHRTLQGDFYRQKITGRQQVSHKLMQFFKHNPWLLWEYKGAPVDASVSFTSPSSIPEAHESQIPDGLSNAQISAKISEKGGGSS